MWEAYARLWGDAAIYAIKEAATQIAVNTGMSAASLLPAIGEASKVSSALGAKEQAALLTDIKSRQKNSKLKGFTDISGSYTGDKYREIKAGIAAGKEFTTFEVGTPANPNFEFGFLIGVFQYEFWEPVWGSLDRATQAFINFLNANSSAYMPSFEKLFPVKRVR